MKKKNLLISLLSICVVTLALPIFMLAYAQQAPPKERIELKYAFTWVEQMAHNQRRVWMFNKLEERTKGRVKVSYLPPGALGSATEMLGLIKTGAADMCEISPAYWPGEFPFWNLPVMMLFKSHDEAITVGTRLTHVRQETAPLFRREEAKQNIRVITHSGSEGPYVFTTKKPVRRLADLKGLKFRSFGKWGPTIYNKMGAVAVTVPFAETYDALKKGVIDGTCMPLWGIYQYKIHEVVNYVSFSLGANGAYGIGIMNLNTWNRLPPDVQKMLEDIALESIPYEIELVKKLSDEAKSAFHITEVPKEEQEYIDKAWWDEVVDKLWIKDMVASGLGKEAELALRVLKEELSKYRKGK